MSEPKPEFEIRQEEAPSLDTTLTLTADLLASGQKYHAAKAQQFGAAKDMLVEFQSYAKTVPDDLIAPYRSGFDELNGYLQGRKDRELSFDPSSAVVAAIGTSTTSVGVATFVRPGETINQFTVRFSSQIPAIWDQARTDKYSEKLRALDPELAVLYRGISGIFFGTIESGERGALGNARQLFDHFFEKLAPDEEVRKSQHFRTKEGDKPDQVHRRERIFFAADAHVPDEAQRAYLTKQATGLLKNYDALQSLHARQALDRTYTQGVLKTYIASIQSWIDAIEIPQMG